MKTFFFKLLSFFLFLICIPDLICAQGLKRSCEPCVTNIFSVAWGNSQDKIPYTKSPGINVGAHSFAVLNDSTIAFLLLEPAEIRIFTNNAGLHQKISLDFQAIDFVFDGEMFHLLGLHAIHSYGLDGQNVAVTRLGKCASLFKRITKIGNDIWLWLGDGNSVRFEHSKEVDCSSSYQGWIVSENSFVKASVDGNRYDFALYNTQQRINIKREYTSDSDVAGIFPVGIKNNKLVFDLQEFENQNPIEIKRSILAIDLNSLEVTSLKMPDCYYVYVDRDIYKDLTGSIYTMTTCENGIEVFEVGTCESINCSGYPQELTSKNYHYNHHLIKVD